MAATARYGKRQFFLSLSCSGWDQIKAGCTLSVLVIRPLLVCACRIHGRLTAVQFKLNLKCSFPRKHWKKAPRTAHLIIAAIDLVP